MKAVIDATLCTGCGLCAAELPDVFEIGDDGLAKVLPVELKGIESRVEEVAQMCPASAIQVQA